MGAIITPSKTRASLAYAGNTGKLGGGNLDRALGRFSTVAEMRAASPLPADILEVFDGTVQRVGRQRLTLVDDMINAGMVEPLPGWLGIPQLKYKLIGQGGHAQRTMVPKARGERQVLQMTDAGIPVFCTWDDFSFDVRTVEAAHRGGYQIETEHAENATLNDNIAIEDQAWNGLTDEAGNPITIGGLSAPGLLTDPTNTFAYAGGEAWDASGHTGEEIIADISGGLAVLDSTRHYGPYRLYVPSEYYTKLSTTDYKAASSDSILDRILQMKQITGVAISDVLSGTDKTLLIQMTKNVADIVLGQQPTLISWTDENRWEYFFVVLACAIFRLKAAPNGGQGYAIGNLT